MTKTKEQLIARQREINETLSEMQSREMNAEVQSEMDTLVREYNNNKRELEVLNMAREAAPAAEFCLTKALRESRAAKKEMNLREAITAGGLAGKAVEVEIQNILEPLYAKSVLAQLGCRWYKGLPMGDVSIPVMGKGSAYWKGETAANADGTSTFGTNIVLKPHRLTTYFEISEQMLLQDTVGVNEAIQRDAINALKDKFEATIFGNEAGTDDKPAGLFYNKTLAVCDTFAKVVNKEADIDDANVYGNLVYLLSNKAKADLRCMKKGGEDGNVMVGGSVDGTPAVATSFIAQANKAPYIYGDFSNLAIGDWGNLIFKVDDSIAYANGKIRIYVTMYVDAKVLREVAFVYGTTRDSNAPTITGDEAISIAAASTAAIKRTYSTSNGAPVIISNSASLPDWLTASVGSGNKVTFTPTANTSGSERTFTVKLGIEGETSNLDVVLTQAAS